MVEANSVIPLYKQIVRALSDSIANGTYRPGDKLPTEAELIEQFGVSRITVRSAIKEMEDAGLVERARGKGTFVSSDTQMYAADDRESFTHSCQLAGKQASTRVLAMGWDFPSLRDAKFLGVDDTQKVLRSRRLRLVDDKPTMLETNSYSAVLSFLEHESLEDSLMAVLDRQGIKMGPNTRTLEVCYASELEAAYLNVELESPLLLLQPLSRHSLLPARLQAFHTLHRILHHPHFQFRNVDISSLHFPIVRPHVVFAS